MIAEESVVARVETLVSSEVDGQVVILNIDSGHFFQLNPMASTIWDLLDTPKDLATIVAQLAVRFEMGGADCRTELADFIDAMQTKGLLTVN